MIDRSIALNLFELSNGLLAVLYHPPVIKLSQPVAVAKSLPETNRKT